MKLVLIYKIGSGEFTDIPFINKLLKKPIIFYYMSTSNEIHKMYKFIKSRAKNDFAFKLPSEYPPNYKDLNLNFISKLIKKYPKTLIGIQIIQMIYIHQLL